MAMCIKEATGIWVCSSSAETLANIVKSGGGGSGSAGQIGDPLNLIWIAKNFRDEIVFDGLM